MARILVIDDDRECLIVMRLLLTQEGHEVFPLMRPDRFIHELHAVNPDLVITDIMMPGITGGSIYAAIRSEVSEDLPVIISSGVKMRLRLPQDPLLEYCPKPIDAQRLAQTVSRLLDTRDRRRAQRRKSDAGTDGGPEN